MRAGFALPAVAIAAIAFGSGQQLSLLGQAQNARVISGITASTTQTQGQGPLTATVHEIDTVANENDTVTMPFAVTGKSVTVINNGANILQVFPASGDAVSHTVNEAIHIPPHSIKEWIAFDGTTWEPIHQVDTKSYSFTSRGVGAGTYFIAGYYNAPATEAVLNQGAATQTLGEADVPYAAHVFFVCKADGAATGGTAGVADVTVTGTSITDAGVRNGSASEVLVADNTDCAVDTYSETSLKWIGQVTLTIAATDDRTTFDLSGNYGFAKYEDFENSDFAVNSIEVVGVAGAADTAFELELLLHSAAGWTYNASAFVPGGTSIADMGTSHSTENDLDNGLPFAFKRAGLGVEVHGEAQEGVIVVLTTGQNNTVQSMSVHIGAAVH